MILDFVLVIISTRTLASLMVTHKQPILELDKRVTLLTKAINTTQDGILNTILVLVAKHHLLKRDGSSACVNEQNMGVFVVH